MRRVPKVLSAERAESRLAEEGRDVSSDWGWAGRLAGCHAAADGGAGEDFGIQCLRARSPVVAGRSRCVKK